QGPKAVVAKLKSYMDELRVAMYLVGASSIKDLRNCDLVIQGETREWLQERGIDTTKYARRSLQ
ncbi:MAG TPA: type 2 isopentenyl-diphosphate Delta-isomerase, partial [Methanobacterium sp.]|nr:type 2 isopentenyl-diphosphate Delta-isomerase [Methanobacterium sp.]